MDKTSLGSISSAFFQNLLDVLRPAEEPHECGPLLFTERPVPVAAPVPPADGTPKPLAQPAEPDLIDRLHGAGY